MLEESVTQKVMKSNKGKTLKRISLLVTTIYIATIIILSQTNDLFSDIYQNNSRIELSFILFISYLIIYIKDAFLMDYIEIVILKKFLPHLIEHTLEPFVLFFLYIPYTWILLQLNIENTIIRILSLFVLPLLYFIVKNKILNTIKNKKSTR